MLSKRGYFIHFARLFFAGLVIGICSLGSYFWQIYQPFIIILQWQQCQSSFADMEYSHVNIWNWLKHFHWSDLLPSFPFLSTTISCHFYIKIEYPIDVIQCIAYVRSILFIYVVYHCICLSLFHSRLKRFEMKQHRYGQLYREDQKNRRRTNRLLLT